MTSVLIAGATGLVGRACLQLALDTPGFTRVTVLARRPSADPVDSPRLEWRVVDFDRLESEAAAFRVDSVVCALGTTIRQAGSQPAFRRVDHDYPVAMAQLASRAGVSHFGLVSALGADPSARVFYSRVKGETERDIRKLSLRGLTIVRPSLLLGDRGEFRLGEEVAKRLGFLVPARLKPVQARDVAAVLMKAALARRPGEEVIESAAISAAARR